MISRYTFFIIFIIILTSCTANQEITLYSNGSGSCSLIIDLAPLFVQYIGDLGEVSGEFNSIDDVVIFDTIQIRDELLSRPGIQVKKVESPNQDRLELDFNFQNIEDIFRTDKVLSSTQVITFKHNKNNKIVHLHLDKENFNQLFSIFPFLEEEIIKSLLPYPKQTKKDYLETIDFAIYDEGAYLVRQSNIRVAITVHGQIIEQKGGIIYGNTVVFNIPLERILYPDPAIDYFIVFR